MGMQNTARMTALQSKGAGAPPEEPPVAPPMAGGPEEMGGGQLPPAEMVVPQIADLLKQLAGTVDEDKKSALMSAAEQLQAAFPASPSEGAGMPEEDSEAYGEPTAGM